MNFTGGGNGAERVQGEEGETSVTRSEANGTHPRY